MPLMVLKVGQTLESLGICLLKAHTRQLHQNHLGKDEDPDTEGTDYFGGSEKEIRRLGYCDQEGEGKI